MFNNFRRFVSRCPRRITMNMTTTPTDMMTITRIMSRHS